MREGELKPKLTSIGGGGGDVKAFSVRFQNCATTREDLQLTESKEGTLLEISTKNTFAKFADQPVTDRIKRLFGVGIFVQSTYVF